MANGKFRLLEAFRQTFAGRLYKHRDSTVGNSIGRQFFEDLFDHGVSVLYNKHVSNSFGVVSRGGQIHGKEIRRNDSVFGRPPAGTKLLALRAGFRVQEGPVAEPRIGCEVKILAKSQQKQIDRVISDLGNFARKMKTLNSKCINIAVVGVNHETDYVGHEGRRTFKDKLGDREPLVVTAKLREELKQVYDEFLIFSFGATNQDPYPFSWLDTNLAQLDYGAVLTRVGELYNSRFA